MRQLGGRFTPHRLRLAKVCRAGINRKKLNDARLVFYSLDREPHGRSGRHERIARLLQDAHVQEGVPKTWDLYEAELLLDVEPSDPAGKDHSSPLGHGVRPFEHNRGGPSLTRI